MRAERECGSVPFVTIDTIHQSRHSILVMPYGFSLISKYTIKFNSPEHNYFMGP